MSRTPYTLIAECVLLPHSASWLLAVAVTPLSCMAQALLFAYCLVKPLCMDHGQPCTTHTFVNVYTHTTCCRIASSPYATHFPHTWNVITRYDLHACKPHLSCSILTTVLFLRLLLFKRAASCGHQGRTWGPHQEHSHGWRRWVPHPQQRTVRALGLHRSGCWWRRWSQGPGRWWPGCCRQQWCLGP
jgi:hypothetical protein